MQNPQIINCNACKTLRCLLPLIDKKLMALIKNKWNSDRYAVSLYFDEPLFSILLRYKRIITSRVSNASYPTYNYSNQDLISKVKLYINK